MSLIIKKNTTFKIPRTPFFPSSLTGLSLWLKADAGVTFSQAQYVSQIVISEAGSSEVDGTYIAASEPDLYGAYNLNKAGSDYSIYYGGIDNPTFNIYVSSGGSYASSDGVTWTIGTAFPESIVISNASIPAANGTYDNRSFFEGTYTYTKGSYYIIVYPGGTFELYESPNTLLYISDQYYGSLPIGTWYDAGAGGTCTGAVPSSSPASPAPTGVVTNSGFGAVNVAGWTDQSGNGRNATTEDNPPIFNSTGLNNKPTLTLSIDNYFIGSTINRAFRISNNPMGASGTTVFVVNKIDSNALYNPFIANGTLLGNFGIGLNGYWGSSTSYTISDSFAKTSRINNITYPDGIRGWNIYSVSSQTNDWKLFFNGTQLAYDNASVYSNAIGGNGNSLYIGKQTDFEGQNPEYFKGDIAEVVIYSRVLTTQERQEVELYLRNKYGFEPEGSGIPRSSTNSVRVVIPSINFNRIFEKNLFFDAFYNNGGSGFPDGFELYFSSNWTILGYDGQLAYNTIPNQTSAYIPQTRWDIPVEITVVS